MQFNIPEELKHLQESVADFIEREVRPVEEHYREELATTGEIAREHALASRRKIRQRSIGAGFYNMHMPPDVGGDGVGVLGMCLCHEAVGRSGLLLAERGSVLAHVEGPKVTLLDGSDTVNERFLMPLMRGERESCFALSEPQAGSDATAIATTVTRTNRGLSISGRKHFISHGADADMAEVFAVCEDSSGRTGIGLVVVDMDSDGVSLGRTQRMMGTEDPVELVFDDVAVSPDQLVGEPGTGLRKALFWLSRSGRMAIAAQSVGRARFLIDQMVQYCRDRTAFGRPIGDYQFIQSHVVDSVIDMRAARSLVLDCARAIDAGKDAVSESAIAKVMATEMVGRVADRAIQVFGGTGLTIEAGIERHYRDVRSLRIVEGTSEVLKRSIARSLGLGV